MAIHPGEMLKDELDTRGISQKDFALLTGIPHTQLNEIIKGKRGIYAETALLIGKALKMDAVLWTNMQMNYELDLAKLNEKNMSRVEAINIWQMIEHYIPISFFKKQKVITGNPIHDIPVVKEIYNVKHVEELAILYSQTQYACFRKSEKLSIDKINLIGWVKLVNYKAGQIHVPEFNIRNRNKLLTRLNDIFRKNKNVVDKTNTALSEYGVKLVIQSHPDHCAVDGISFWSNGNPAIGLTVRHNRLDNFAFTVMHELGHVFLHLVNNNTAEFIDLDKNFAINEYKKSVAEKEANEFSRNALINSDSWDEFINENPVFDEIAIREFAHKQKVNPAIVQGRFCFETNMYKVRSDIAKALG